MDKLLIIGAVTLLALLVAMNPGDQGTSEKTSVVTKPQKVVSASGYDIRPLKTAQDEWRKLMTQEQFHVTCLSGTETPFQNEYWNHHAKGTYVCVAGGLPVFRSDDKFDSGTGWPSFFRPFDPDHVVLREDRSHGMMRIEVLCARSGAHLGHLFDDGPAPTGKRFCINSAALRFIPDGQPLPPESQPLSPEEQLKLKGMSTRQTALFGAGCFWGVEETFRTLPGVIETDVGYSGGALKNPTYKEVCTDRTGHVEVVHITYDPSVISYEKLLEVFFENHDPTQVDRQGPDVGKQYRSVIFYYSPEQQKAAEAAMEALQNSGRYRRKLSTQIEPAGEFWRAEEYHQEYLKKRGMTSCHVKP